MKKSILLLAVVALLGSCKKEEQINASENNIALNTRDIDPSSDPNIEYFNRCLINTDVNHIDHRQYALYEIPTNSRNCAPPRKGDGSYLRIPMSVRVTPQNTANVLSFSGYASEFCSRDTKDKNRNIMFGRSFGLINDYRANALYWEVKSYSRECCGDSIEVFPVVCSNGLKTVGAGVILPHWGKQTGGNGQMLLTYKWEIKTELYNNGYLARFIITKLSPITVVYDGYIAISNFSGFKTKYSWYILPKSFSPTLPVNYPVISSWTDFQY